MSNFLLGGRTGDLIHALYVAKNTPGQHNLFITDRRDLHSDGFHLGLDETYKQLAPIIEQQPWCMGFDIHRGLYRDDELTNLSMWRRYAYSTSWTQLLANTFNVPVNGEPWINIEPVAYMKNIILVHESVHAARRGHNWDLVMSKYEGQCVFIGSDEEKAAFKYNLPHINPSNLLEFFTLIRSCKFFIGNQSAPLAMAHSMGVPRLAMLNEIDKIHYVGEERFCKDFFWMADGTHYFPGINY